MADAWAVQARSLASGGELPQCGRPQALLFHGLAGTPFEIEPVARRLEQEGFSVHTPLLPGHGSDRAACLAMSFSDWRNFARAQYHQLSAQGPLLLGGYSLGGILALELAEHIKEQGFALPLGLLLLATPLRFGAWRKDWRLSGKGSWRFRFLPLLARLWPVIAMPKRSEQSRAMAPWQGHEEFCCLRHFAQMEAALKGIRKRLSLVQSPLCIIQLRHDASAPPAQAAWLLAHCASPEAQLHILQTQSQHGGHLPATHLESRERVAEIASCFARTCLERKTSPGRP